MVFVGIARVQNKGISTAVGSSAIFLFLVVADPDHYVSIA